MTFERITRTQIPSSPRDLSIRALRSRVRGSTVIRQSLAFAGSNVVTTLAAGVTSAILARSLTTNDYGILSFSTSFLALFALLFELGLFLPMARLAALAEGRARRVVEGAAIGTFVPIGILFSLLVFFASFVVDDIFRVQAGLALRVAAPLAFIYPFAQFGVLLSQGDGRLHLYSLWSATAQVIYLTLVAGVSIEWGFHGPVLPLVLRGIAFALCSIALAVSLRPIFEDVGAHARRFVRHSRQYGFQVFIGRVFSIGTYSMDVLMLAALTNPRAVALYALAGSLTAAAGLPITGLGIALFRRLVGQDRLEKRWLLLAWLVSLVCAAVVTVIARPIITLFFSGRYADAAALVGPLALAQAVRGVTGIYNSFLAAHGRGRELSRAAMVLTGSNICFNLALIPSFAAAGAAWASFFALLVNLLAHVFYYRQVVGKPRAGESSPARSGVDEACGEMPFAYLDPGHSREASL